MLARLLVSPVTKNEQRSKADTGLGETVTSSWTHTKSDAGGQLEATMEARETTMWTTMCKSSRDDETSSTMQDAANMLGLVC